MNQLNLTFPSASRNTDPITSHLAEEEVTKSGARQTQAEIVLERVRNNPGATAFELANFWCRLDRYQVQRRLSDLDNLGKIKKGPKRICMVSGRLSVTWEIK